MDARCMMRPTPQPGLFPLVRSATGLGWPLPTATVRLVSPLPHPHLDTARSSLPPTVASALQQQRKQDLVHSVPHLH